MGKVFAINLLQAILLLLLISDDHKIRRNQHAMKFSIDTFKEEARKAQKSDAYIERYTLYARKLMEQGLPVIFDIGHLAHYMKLSLERLIEISNKKEYFYYLSSKRNGGKRRIIVPNDELKNVQRWINKQILQSIVPLACVTGFAKGRSIVNNAGIHENRKYILNFDIKDFFESITEDRVERLFLKMEYKRELASLLTKLCTTKVNGDYIRWKCGERVYSYFEQLTQKDRAFLVQGAPTSPAIANLICYRMDRKLMKYAERHGINYSRYADDITFSSDDIASLPKVRFIKKLLAEEHFVLNEEKTKLLKQGMRQEVTGLLINERVRVPRQYKKDIYRHLHFCLKYGGLGHFKYIHSSYNMSREWLLGRIFYVNAVEPEDAKKMLYLFNQVDWLRE